MISGAVKSVVILTTVSLIAAALFDFNITAMGLANLALAFMNLTVFAIAVGLVILGIIFRYGTRIQALAWGVIFLFQPLTAVYFPVDTLPPFLRSAAHLFPPTYVFEMARDNLSDQSIQWGMVLTPLLLNLLYVSGSLWFFGMMYTASRRSGQFAKLGT